MLCMRLRTNGGIGDDDHYVGVGRELIDVGRKCAVLDLHSLELCLRLAAAELELLDDVRIF